MTLLKERKVKKKKKTKENKKTHILDVYRRTMVTGCVCIWNIDVKKKNLTPGRALALAKYIGFLLPLWLRMATLMNHWIDKLHPTFHCSIVFQGAELFFRLPPLH